MKAIDRAVDRFELHLYKPVKTVDCYGHIGVTSFNDKDLCFNMQPSAALSACEHNQFRFIVTLCIAHGEYCGMVSFSIAVLS
jgi:hypothetical protein